MSMKSILFFHYFLSVDASVYFLLFGLSVGRFSFRPPPRFPPSNSLQVNILIHLLDLLLLTNISLSQPTRLAFPGSSPLSPSSPTLIMSDASAPPLNSSDPNTRVLSSSCFDFLLIELVPMAERLARELSAAEKDPEDEELRESTYFRLESLGYRVGQGLAER